MSEDEGDEEEPSILNADSTSETWQLPWGKSGTLVEVEGEEGAEMQAESILGAAFLTESENLRSLEFPEYLAQTSGTRPGGTRFAES